MTRHYVGRARPAVMRLTGVLRKQAHCAAGTLAADSLVMPDRNSAPTAAPTGALTAMALPGQIAADLLRAVRAGDAAGAGAAERALSSLPLDVLTANLADDPTRITFWLNIYNAATQRLVVHDPGGRARRWRFFRRRAIVVAGQSLSLDAIEHGLLRRSRWRVGLGYLGNPQPRAFERLHRVARVDPRIHFALNCAAASCPPIAAYDATHLDAQLDLAARGYLAASVRIRDGRLEVPRLFLWFVGDFGGRAGVRRFIASHGVDPSGRQLRFAAYDWRVALGHWAPYLPADAPPPSHEP